LVVIGIELKYKKIMKVLDHKKFACFNYESQTSKRFKLGDIVINEENEIGVILQIHNNDEFRTDMFGNCHYLEIRKATKKEISTYRRELLDDILNVSKEHNDNNRLLGVRAIIKTHTEKLNIMKDNLSRWEEERWTEAEIRECENMIKILASILSDLNRSLA